MKRVLITLVIVLLTNLSFSNALETSKTINVNVTVKDFLRIFNMNNEDDNISLTVDNENIEKKLEGRKDFCVRSTKKSYKLKARGEGDNESFVVKNDEGDSVEFELLWGREGNKESLFSDKETKESYQVADKKENCEGGVSTLFVNFADGAFMGKHNGNYRGSVTLTITTE